MSHTIQGKAANSDVILDATAAENPKQTPYKNYTYTKWKKKILGLVYLLKKSVKKSSIGSKMPWWWFFQYQASKPLPSQIVLFI